ncbi:MAG TPA: hypothetical protein VF043_07225 [Ktedonobacteraceae bacterium]
MPPVEKILLVEQHTGAYRIAIVIGVQVSGEAYYQFRVHPLEWSGRTNVVSE